MSLSKKLTAVALLAAYAVTFSVTSAKEQSRTVSARVTGGAGRGVGIRATREPGHFTVPKGHVATGFSYRFHDPADNYSSTRLGPSNIYSITLGREMREAEGNPNVELPPGEYKFVVGGRPGASGSLSFKILSTTATPSPDDLASNNPQLPKDFDVTYDPRTDFYIIDDTGRKRFGDIEGIDYWNSPSTVIVRFRNGQVSSEWELRHDEAGSAIRNVTKLVGTLANGRFVGKDVNSTEYCITHDERPLSWQSGMVWSLNGQVDSQGKLVIHSRWESDHGQQPEHRTNGNGDYAMVMKPHQSHPDTKAMRAEIHLQLPIGQSRSSKAFVRTQEKSDDLASHGLHPTPTPNDPGIGDVPVDSVWSDDNDSGWEDPDWPPVVRDDSNQPEVDNIWTNDRSTDDRLVDGKILFKPPWDEGDPYPMDEDDVEAIRKKQSEGFRWDKRHGWVDDDRQIEIDDIADIQRRNDEKEKQRSQDIFKELSKSRKRAKEHADKAKRAGDEAIADKVKDQGWNSLTQDGKAPTQQRRRRYQG